MTDSRDRTIETRLRAAVESAPSGLLMTDATGRIVLVNREVERLFGYSREELLGQLIEQLIPTRYHKQHPAYRKGFRADPRVRAMGAGRDLRGRRKDGTEVPVEVGLTPVATEEGLFVIGSVVDISARIRAEEEQRAIAEQLRQAQKMEAVGTLAGGIAHDFNNLLGAIVGYAELIERAVETQPDIKADVQEILTAAQRGRRLVRNILTFSQRREALRVPVQLGSVVREVQHLLRATIPATIHLEVSIPTDLPRVMADSTSVHQVIMHLATNATQAMPNGGDLEIALDRLYAHDHFVRANPSLHEGWYTMLRVRDSGSGMDGAILSRATEPFFTTKPAGQGTGLGLSVVHGIMQEHGGSLQITSTPGEGTEVRCLFPIIPSEEFSTPASATPAPPPGTGEHILYVDDESALVTLGERRLRLHGYQVTGVHSPADALQLVREHPERYRLLVTDYTMPGMNGLQLAHAITQLQPTLPIVLLTGYIDEIPADVLRSAGIRRVLAKPATSDELAQLCYDLLGDDGEITPSPHGTS